jgi:zinc transporter ZupT
MSCTFVTAADHVQFRSLVGPGSDRRFSGCPGGSDPGADKLGEALPSLLRRPGCGIHAGGRLAGDGSRELSSLLSLDAPLLILGGYCLIHLLEHTITPHFHFGEETHHGEFISVHTSNSVVAGLASHSLFDGVAIASGFVLSSWLGWIIFIAILLHKLPEGFTVASVMLASGHSRGAALTSAAIVAAATVAGVLIINFFPGWVRAGLPIAAGEAIYVTATDLVPEVNREPGIRMALVFFGGVAAFLVCKFIADGVLR